ncbi:5-deoxy-glucuronate isomerase [Cypionkella aquatica]|uniref:5-deoxy-glucuronate isomerase n=1 Tax=Cypionkella aquatica TaxID=1756042 RepID=A0AA37X026_9RHOB|nr:5-deoxy-glucuronate isomerase [Cypionkella aquatica]GLS86777.1 5-deoxy-glucuronate isomerase [Cypionkella aquatica]
MHIAPYDNQNQPIIGADHDLVPLVYFNIIHLTRGQSVTSQVAGYETCIVPATGTIDITCGSDSFASIGKRVLNVWDAEPEAAYIPTGAAATLTCTSDRAEVFVAGARSDQAFAAFAIRADAIDSVQYGSDDTKTHRKIKHILGTKYHDRVGRLLVSELYTVGTGGWSGFPSHKHDTDRLPLETHHDEAYNFRFNPPHGSGLQMLQREDGQPGDAYHLVNGSTVVIDKGYHPCCVLPGYEMYYFTILAGKSQRSLVQYFQPSHADQIETIPGIKDMIAKFK